MEEQESSASDDSVLATISGYPIGHDFSEILDEGPLEWYSPSSKKSKTDCGDQDRISALPDPIIQYILSFLDAENILKTSVLSKRWRNVWAAVPSLKFCFPRYPLYYKHHREWASNIDKTLRLYTGSKLEKFAVGFRYDNCLSSQIDEWIHFATRRHVEELSLDFGDTEKASIRPYRLPPHIFSSSTLRTLNTVFCSYQQIGVVSWSKLKVLSIAYATSTNETIAKILSGSPMLEYLRLQCCHGINQLIISSPNLKELVIDNASDRYASFLGRNYKPVIVEISAPTISSFSLLGNMYRRKYKVIDMSSVVEANISYTLLQKYGISFDQKHCYMLKELLDKLRHVQKLTIGNWCLQILSKWEEKSPILCKLKSLTIDSSIHEKYLPMIASLLESSPELEKLTVNLMSSSNSEVQRTIHDIFGGEKPCASTERIYRCLPLHLKIVEVTGFPPSPAGKTFCSLMEFLLENAKVLEKMIIHAKGEHLAGSWDVMRIKQKVQDFLEVNQLLLSFPRASPNAVVLLENPFK